MMQGQPGQMMQGQPGQMIQGQPGQMMQWPPGQVMQGQPGQMVQGQPGQMVQGLPGQMVQGQPGQMIQGQPPMLKWAPGQRNRPPGQMMLWPPGQMMQGPPGQISQWPPGQMMPGQFMPSGQMFDAQGQPIQPGQMFDSTGQPIQPNKIFDAQGQPIQPGQMFNAPGQSIPPVQMFDVQGQPIQPGQTLDSQGQPIQPGQVFDAQGQPIQPGQMLNSLGQPIQPGQIFNSQGQPIQPGQMFNSQGQPIQPGQMFDAQGQPILPVQMFDAQGQPLQAGQMFDAQGQPIQPGQIFDAQGQPIQPGQIFDAEGKPVEIGKATEGEPAKEPSVSGEELSGEEESLGEEEVEEEHDADMYPTTSAEDTKMETSQVNTSLDEKVKTSPSGLKPVHRIQKPQNKFHRPGPSRGHHPSRPIHHPHGPAHHKKECKLNEQGEEIPPTEVDSLQRELQQQYGHLQGMQRKLAGDIQDKMEFIYQRLLKELMTQQMTTSPFMTFGPEKCLGPGVCHGHVMPADVAAIQFADPNKSEERERKKGTKEDRICPGGAICPGADVCAHCQDANQLHLIKPPKKPFKDEDDEADKRGLDQPKDVMDILKDMKSRILLPHNLDELRAEMKADGKIVDTTFDETDILEKIATLWEAVQALKHNDEETALHLFKHDNAIQKIPFGSDDGKPQKAPTNNLDSIVASSTENVGVPSKPTNMSQAEARSQSVRKLDAPDSLSKDDIQLIFTNINDLVVESAANKQKLDTLAESVRVIENQIVTKQILVDALSDKADKGQMNTKVSYDEFGNSMDELMTRMQNLLVEVYQNNETWKRVTDHLGDELSEKLDKTEFAPVRAYFKSHLMAVEERVRNLTELLEEPDPAGTRRKLLKDMNCVSCNRSATISGVTNAPTLPTMEPIRAGHQSASRRAFDLHNMRAHVS